MEYKISKLKEITTYIARGITPKYTEDKENGIVVLNQKCIRDYRINYKESKMHNIKEKKVSKEKVLKKYDILINSTGVGTAGRVAQYMEKDNSIIVDSHVTIVRPDEFKIEPLYLGYAIKEQQTTIEKMAEGSTGQTEINRNRLGEEILIKYPTDTNIQTIIANILYDIDKKIELNNKINDNLLEIGTELLKNDFILENEKETLSQVIKFVKGKKPNDIIINKQVGYEKYLTIACLNGQELNYADTNKMIMSDNDLLMVMDGASSGEVYYGGQGIVGSTLARIDCTDNNYISEFIFFCLIYYKDLIKSKNTGSAIPHTDKVFVGSLEIPKLDINKQEKYKVLLSKLQHNKNENNTLVQLRDTLLPKLMNGKYDWYNLEK